MIENSLIKERKEGCEKEKMRLYNSRIITLKKGTVILSLVSLSILNVLDQIVIFSNQLNIMLKPIHEQT